MDQAPSGRLIRWRAPFESALVDALEQRVERAHVDVPLVRVAFPPHAQPGVDVLRVRHGVVDELFHGVGRELQTLPPFLERGLHGLRVRIKLRVHAIGHQL